jgi:K+-H+ exchange-related protein
VNEVEVYLVPVGSGRYELYSEPRDESSSDPLPEDGTFWRRKVRALGARWREATEAASGEAAGSRLGRVRDWMVRRLAESIAEQRTLWALRGAEAASFVHPADLPETAAAQVRIGLLARARGHHRRGAWVNAAATVVTAALVLLPGPNIVGYYFIFRMVGHALSWRGARQALDRIEWRARAEPGLTELGRLAHRSRAERAEQVARLGEDLRLPGLAAFFDRTASRTR